ncbi:MAG: hypothetical protein L3J91_01540, partial [Thermoplasmata archaeon]|nr:hypothetical protein [Thermoplasmata archaeon]
EVVKATLQVTINENNAKALVKEAEGVRDSTRIRADGDAAAIRRVGEAQADAYHAQADVLGSERVALVKVMEQVSAGKIKITPDTLVSTSGTDGSGASTLFSAYLATLLRQQATTPTKTYKPVELADYQSSLTQDTSSNASSTASSPPNANPPSGGSA